MKFAGRVFRHVRSADREGFVLFYQGKVGFDLLEDLLMQLFRPLYPRIRVPDLHCFDEFLNTLSMEEIFSEKFNPQEAVFVHFMQKGLPDDAPLAFSGLPRLNSKLREGRRIYVLSLEEYRLYGNSNYLAQQQAHLELVEARLESARPKLESFCKLADSVEQDSSSKRVKQELSALSEEGDRLLSFMANLTQISQLANKGLEQEIDRAGLIYSFKKGGV